MAVLGGDAEFPAGIAMAHDTNLFR